MHPDTYIFCYLLLSFSKFYLQHGVWQYSTLQSFPPTAPTAECGHEAVRKLEGEGLSPQLVTLDVSSEESVRAARQVVEEQYKRVDVLVNNAAVLPKVKCDGALLRCSIVCIVHFN